QQPTLKSTVNFYDFDASGAYQLNSPAQTNLEIGSAVTTPLSPSYGGVGYEANTVPWAYGQNAVTDPATLTGFLTAAMIDKATAVDNVLTINIYAQRTATTYTLEFYDFSGAGETYAVVAASTATLTLETAAPAFTVPTAPVYGIGYGPNATVPWAYAPNDTTNAAALGTGKLTTDMIAKADTGVIKVYAQRALIDYKIVFVDMDENAIPGFDNITKNHNGVITAAEVPTDAQLLTADIMNAGYTAYWVEVDAAGWFAAQAVPGAVSFPLTVNAVTNPNGYVFKLVPELIPYEATFLDADDLPIGTPVEFNAESNVLSAADIPADTAAAGTQTFEDGEDKILWEVVLVTDEEGTAITDHMLLGKKYSSEALAALELPTANVTFQAVIVLAEDLINITFTYPDDIDEDDQEIVIAPGEEVTLPELPKRPGKILKWKVVGSEDPDHIFEPNQTITWPDDLPDGTELEVIEEDDPQDIPVVPPEDVDDDEWDEALENVILGKNLLEELELLEEAMKALLALAGKELVGWEIKVPAENEDGFEWIPLTEDTVLLAEWFEGDEDEGYTLAAIIRAVAQDIVAVIPGSITFDLNEGRWPLFNSQNPIPITDTNKTKTLAVILEENNVPTPTRLGYNFKGWSIGGDIVDLETYVLSANQIVEGVVLKAEWEKKDNTISGIIPIPIIVPIPLPIPIPIILPVGLLSKIVGGLLCKTCGQKDCVCQKGSDVNDPDIDDPDLNDPDYDDGYKKVDTGDSIGIALFAALGLSIAAAGVMILRKKREDEE
ncbi:MAG: hypothetical protein FWH26_10335, partial [Oscillospiraceae bacterium]|nr:hypothetical protein [Oscillospiraceae bacterium]